MLTAAHACLLSGLMFASAPLAAEEGVSSSRPAASRPSSFPQLKETLISRIRLDLPSRATPGFYWLSRPAGYGRDQKPALLICLHGTDDTARQMIDFWGGRTCRVPLIIAAPQGMAPGWRDEDLPTIRAMLAHLQENVSYDRTRVFMAGFSAGGAMSLYLLYTEKLPFTAVAALANYVPPGVTAADVLQQASTPVFYAVGMTDVNHEKMRDGIDLLRSAGGNVNLYRPPIGHVLDPGVAQEALDWMFDESGRALSDWIQKSPAAPEVSPAALRLEEIVEQARWHEPKHVEEAGRMLVQVHLVGNRDLKTARKFVAEQRYLEAYDLLLRVQSLYGASSLGRLAATLRRDVEARPGVLAQLTERQSRRREQEAVSLYAEAQRFVADRQYAQAKGHCRRILGQYADTPTAARASYLLNLLETRVQNE